MPVYVSDLFTATAAPVNATPTSTRTWQWLRGSSAISGATSATYTAVTADIGSTLSATQLETNFLATTTATSAATEVVQAFDPIRLFSASEPGVWYDPTDMSTLYQNVTGTIPVTSFGQPVGLMLDKSRGLVLGPELVTNGDFSGGTTGWTGSGASIAVVSGELEVTGGAGTGRASQTAIPTTAGVRYKLTLNGRTVTSSANIYIYNTSNDANLLALATVGSTSATYTGSFVATGTSVYIWLACSTGVVGYFDNVSIKAIPGLHATQSTDASRPLYGIVPVSGRRNALTFSEAFGSASWYDVSTGTTTKTLGQTDPLGGTTAVRLVGNNASTWLGQNIGPISAGTYTFSVWLRSDSAASATLILSYGPGDTIQPISLTTAWQRFNVTGVRSATAGLFGVINIGNGVPVYAWGAQLETGSTPTAYQRVSTDLDVTEAGVASVGYLRFDGSTSWMVTPTITPGTDKVQVFAGARVFAPSSSYAAIAETSPIFDGNGGVFTMGNTSSTVVWGSKGGVIATTTPAQTLPANLVLTGLGDIPADVATLRANGAQVGQVTTDQGTGNYLPWPMYIGRRGGTSIAFNGHLFPLIVRFGPNLTAARIAATESWVATKTAGVTLP